MSNRSSTRVLALLACWPPGPPLGLKRTAISETSTAQSGVTSSHSVTAGTCACSDPNGRVSGRPTLGGYDRVMPERSPIPVALVHGFATSCARTWGDTGWLDLLADAGRPTIRIDLLGHGESAKPHDPEAYEALEQLVFDQLPDEPVDAVGFSLGARTLLALASVHPERFRRLVVAGVGANLFRHDGSSALLADAISGHPEADESPVGQYFQGLASQPGNDPLALAACLRRLAPPLTNEGLAGITSPVLVVLGDQDFAGPPDPLVERLADPTLVVLRGVDHFATPKDFGFLDAGLEFLGAQAP